MTPDQNELTPRERGLMIGRAWAESQEADPITALQLATKGTIPDDVRTREKVLDALVDYIENPKAFWEGFIHGVRVSRRPRLVPRRRLSLNEDGRTNAPHERPPES